MDKVISRDHMKYYKLHNVDFTIKNGKTILRFNMICSAFDPKTSNCKVYLNRPVFCMKFPQPEDADKLPKECGFRFDEEEI
jgi:Fe-S-cluster containining protein